MGIARVVLVVLVVLSARAQAGPTCPEPPCAGNAWHVPTGAEPGIASMRTPVRARVGEAVAIYSGNQAAGAAGNPGNQLQAGSAVIWRAGGAWTEAPMTFVAEVGNNKYYRATVPGGAAGEVEYYLRIAYSDHPTTFVHGADARSATTLDEATARAAPFRYVVERPLAPTGAAHELAGARAYDSGHVALADRVTLAPPLVRIDGAWRQLGDAAIRADGDALVLEQPLAGAVVRSRIAPAGDGIVRYEVVDWGGLAVEAIELQAASPADERMFGLGEKFDRVEQSGKVARVLAVDAPGDKGDRSYKVVPWFASTRGYGFHLDSTAESWFDLRASRADRWIVAQEHPRLAVHLVAGAPAEALSRWTTIAGRPPAPPAWVWAPWLSSDHWRDGGEIRYVVSTYRALGLPGSVIVFDSPWEVAYNDLVWNAAQWARGGSYDGAWHDGFATPGEMLAFLDDAGFKVVLWMTPFVNLSSHDEGVPGAETGRASIYDEAAAAGYFVREAPGGAPLVVDWWKGRGSPIDFTNPAARAWWQARLAALVEASGGVIAGFKTDDGESDFIPLHASYFDGRRGDEMRNAYSVAYHGAIYEVLGPEGILWSRSGFTGTQAFPGHWAGDNEPNYGAGNGLPSVIVAGLSAAMSGWSVWGHDIGGYQDANPSSTPEDLFMRWTQFGAVSPIMQIHRQIHAGRQYPWSYGDVALENYRRWATLHTRLQPYLDAHAHEAARTGMPILRPLVLAHPDDPATHGVDHTFYVGASLLAAPVIENEATRRAVYLPAGRWFDWFTGAEHAGGAVIEWASDDPLEMPLFVRDGAIVPMLADAPLSLVEVPRALDVAVWPAGTTSLILGDGTVLSATETTFAIDGAARPYTLRIRAAAPRQVRRDGAPIEFTHDGERVVVAFEHAGGATALELVYGDDEPEPDPAGEGPEAGGCCDGGGGASTALLSCIVLGAAARGRRGRGRASPRRSAPPAAARTDRGGRAARGSSPRRTRRRSPAAA